MSRVGRCPDNAPMEGWWGILKSEMYYLKKITSREMLVSAIEDYIHFYNNRRFQKRLNCMTPCEYYLATSARRKISPCCAAGGEKTYSINKFFLLF